MRLRWIWILVPLGLGTIIAFLFLRTDFPNPLLFAQVDLGTLVLGLGLGLSILTAIVFAAFDRLEKFQIDTIIQSAEHRRRFLRRLDHELKNPLTAILAGLANLAIAESSKERDLTLRSVQTQVGRMRQLVAELRKLSELETRPLDLGQVEMTELLEETFVLTKDTTGADQRELTISIPRAPWPLPVISGDRDL
jgi:two-component system OmpR family sensor kinase